MIPDGATGDFSTRAAGRMACEGPAERSRVQRAEPQQGNGVLSQRAIQEQIVPRNEMCNEVAHAPSGAERLVLPLLGGEVAEQHPNVSSLIAHHPATGDAVLV